MSFEGRRSLTSGSKSKKSAGKVGTVKKVDKAPNSNERKVEVKFENERGKDSIYVPKKFAKDLKPEHKYEFHLEDSAFRGGGQRRFSGSGMLQRTKLQPTEVTSSGFGKRSEQGDTKRGGGGFDGKWS